MMFNRQEKIVTTNTSQGSSSSTTVKRTVISSSTTFHSHSSSTFIQSTSEPTKLEFRLFENKPRIQTSNQPTFYKAEVAGSKEPKLLEIKPNQHQRSVQSSNVPYRKEEVVTSPKSEITTSSSDINIQQFQLDCLKAHNGYRRKHGVAPLKLDATLSNFAQNWANTIARKRQLQHSSERKYGENIYWSSGSVNGNIPVDSWYDENKQYNYNNASFSSGTGHFTQVVWKSSCDLGVGVACVGNEVYVVASYYPPGNYSGEFSKNVLPPK